MNDHLIGTHLGPYEVQSLLGKGGMATVYRGFDHALQRPVAIKVLSEEANQLDVAHLFQREAQIIASLRHPHIVQIYAFAQHHDRMYMVQELLTGLTLRQHLRDLRDRGERLSRQDIVSIIVQLGSALDTAHAAGIIHRDVKPANVMWNTAGEVVLTDFGIAKRILTSDTHTHSGVVIGTPAYLSPEQAQGFRLTPASDIYALGVLLFELIAGRIPFESDSPMGVIIHHIQTPPPPIRPYRPDIPPAVESVVQRALAKNPAARFNRATDMARALKRAWPPAMSPAARVMTINIHTQETKSWRNGHASTTTSQRLDAVHTPSPYADQIPSNNGSHPAKHPSPMPHSPSFPFSSLPAPYPMIITILPLLVMLIVVLMILGMMLGMTG